MISGDDTLRGRKRVFANYHESDVAVNVIFKNFLRRQLSETERETITSLMLRDVFYPRLDENTTVNVGLHKI